MTSKQLVLAALQGQAVPRVPVGPLAVHYCAGPAGYSLRRYTTDPNALADSVLRYYERFRPDAVVLSADTWVSAEAMGAQVGDNGENRPFGDLGGPLIRSAADIDRIPSPNVGVQGRYPLMLEALTHIAKKLGDEVFLVGCFDQYPFSLAAALMGINEIMFKLSDDPPFVVALMERCLEYAMAYGSALSKAGADLLTGGDSPAGLIGGNTYRQIALPFEKRLIAGLQSVTGKPVSLHICGNPGCKLADMAGSGAEVLELDHKVDLAQACRVVDPEITIWGNIDPISVLLYGSPALVQQTTWRALETVREAGRRRFVLSSGCTLAIETPEENVAALIASTRYQPIHDCKIKEQE
jgi:uroporphyrinogen decarboxylase